MASTENGHRGKENRLLVPAPAVQSFMNTDDMHQVGNFRLEDGRFHAVINLEAQPVVKALRVPLRAGKELGVIMISPCGQQHALEDREKTPAD